MSAAGGSRHKPENGGFGFWPEPDLSGVKCRLAHSPSALDQSGGSHGTAIIIGRREFIGALGRVAVGLWLAQLAPTVIVAAAGPRSVGLPHLSSNVDLVGKIRHMMRHID
jgi:hypothetical protein